MLKTMILVAALWAKHLLAAASSTGPVNSMTALHPVTTPLREAWRAKQFASPQNKYEKRIGSVLLPQHSSFHHRGNEPTVWQGLLKQGRVYDLNGLLETNSLQPCSVAFDERGNLGVITKDDKEALCFILAGESLPKQQLLYAAAIIAKLPNLEIRQDSSIKRHSRPFVLLPITTFVTGLGFVVLLSDSRDIFAVNIALGEGDELNFSLISCFNGGAYGSQNFAEWLDVRVDISTPQSLKEFTINGGIDHVAMLGKNPAEVKKLSFFEEDCGQNFSHYSQASQGTWVLQLMQFSAGRQVADWAFPLGEQRPLKGRFSPQDRAYALLNEDGSIDVFWNNGGLDYPCWEHRVHFVSESRITALAFSPRALELLLVNERQEFSLLNILEQEARPLKVVAREKSAPVEDIFWREDGLIVMKSLFEHRVPFLEPYQKLDEELYPLAEGRLKYVLKLDLRGNLGDVICFPQHALGALWLVNKTNVLRVILPQAKNVSLRPCQRYFSADDELR